LVGAALNRLTGLVLVGVDLGRFGSRDALNPVPTRLGGSKEWRLALLLFTLAAGDCFELGGIGFENGSMYVF
jgi:hypothetical protein